MAKLFPVFLNLDGRDVLVIGGGRVALEKLTSLKVTGAEITLIAKEISEETNHFIKGMENVQVFMREVHYEDLDNRFLIFAATNNSTLNADLRIYANRKKILINAVDDPVNCDFYSSSVIDKGLVRVAISTNGQFPGFSKTVKKILDLVLPDEHLETFKKIFQFRKQLKEKISSTRERSQILGEITNKLEQNYFRIKQLEEIKEKWES